MSDPTTINILLSVPTRGSDTGTWDVPVNGNSNALDGYLGGVQPLSISNAPITLTAPSGTVTAGAGPTQAQNAVLRASGAMTAPVQITLPLPGYYIVENLTTGAFVLSFRALGAGQIIAVDQGETQHIYNDGNNVKFINLGRIGHTELWAGLTAIPPWVTSCTVPPYLLCDGSIYNFSTYPYLGARLLSQFGGNGITTFGVPDHRGRVALPYDGTGTRITTGGSGLNGQLVGASLDAQVVALVTSQIPPINSSALNTITASAGGASFAFTTAPGPAGGSAAQSGSGLGVPNGTIGSWSYSTSFQFNQTINVTTIGTSGTAHNNVQPSQVTGISVIRAA